MGGSDRRPAASATGAQRHADTIARQMPTADRVFAVRSALSDRSKRVRHAARHVGGRFAPPGHVFNLDAHIAVIADVREALQARGISVTSWSISGHAWE